MKKRLLMLPLGCLGTLLSSFIGIPILVIVLCVSLVHTSSSAFGITLSAFGPGSGGNTNARQTQHFTRNTNEAVVNAARTLVPFFYACGDGHYNCYTANFPAPVLHYLDDACGNPHCPYAQSGNFQCVFFVLAVYYMAGQTLPAGPNAVDFWGVYQNALGWQEIPANGTPEPGDLAVFSGPPSGPLANPAGHIGIIIDVAVPASDGTGGFVELAQANGLKAVENLPLIQTNPGQTHAFFRVTAWSGYTLLGYIRSATNG